MTKKYFEFGQCIEPGCCERLTKDDKNHKCSKHQKTGICNNCGEEGISGDWRYDKLREVSYCVRCEEQYWQDVQDAEGDNCYALKH